MSQNSNLNSFSMQLERIAEIATEAKDRLDRTAAEDYDMRHAIDVVEQFLRRKHRLCYGGQAINAHLPSSQQFYDPRTSLPDYDFFSPQSEADIRILLQDLKRAGFTELSIREGMHEGTIKLYVNFQPIADITAMDSSLYRLLAKREYRLDGISYLDVNTLRMLMYLELSRPHGEVTRWPKVYERLLLLQSVKPPSCSLAISHSRNALSLPKTRYTVDMIQRKNYLFAGLDLVSFYDYVIHKHTSSKRPHIQWLYGTKKPILFYSPTPEEDAKELISIYQDMDLHPDAPSKKPRYRVETKENKGVDLIPSLTLIYQGKQPVVFIVEESACHAHLSFPTDKGALRVATMDTLITLYFSLGLIRSKWMSILSMECLANQLLQLSIKQRSTPSEARYQLPFLSLACTGHQASVPSLIRAKVKRLTEKKTRLKDILRPESMESKKRITVKSR